MDGVGGSAGGWSSMQCSWLLGLTQMGRRTGFIDSVPCALMLLFRAGKSNPQTCPGAPFHGHFHISGTPVVVQSPPCLYWAALRAGHRTLGGALAVNCHINAGLNKARALPSVLRAADLQYQEAPFTYTCFL